MYGVGIDVEKIALTVYNPVRRETGNFQKQLDFRLLRHGEIVMKNIIALDIVLLNQTAPAAFRAAVCKIYIYDIVILKALV